MTSIDIDGIQSNNIQIDTSFNKGQPSVIRESAGETDSKNQRSVHDPNNNDIYMTNTQGMDRMKTIYEFSSKGLSTQQLQARLGEMRRNKSKTKSCYQ